MTSANIRVSNFHEGIRVPPWLTNQSPFDVSMDGFGGASGIQKKFDRACCRVVLLGSFNWNLYIGVLARRPQ
jgi:hypothetical protein